MYANSIGIYDSEPSVCGLSLVLQQLDCFFIFMSSSASLAVPHPLLIRLCLDSSLAPVPIATNTVPNSQQFKYRLSRIGYI